MLNFISNCSDNLYVPLLAFHQHLKKSYSDTAFFIYMYAVNHMCFQLINYCLLFPFSHSILYLGCASLPVVAVSFLAHCLDWPYVHHLHKHCNNINYFVTQTFNQATINSQRRGLISGEKIIKNSTCCVMKPPLHPTIIKKSYR